MATETTLEHNYVRLENSLHFTNKSSVNRAAAVAKHKVRRWAPAFLCSPFCDLSETLGRGLQALRVVLGALQKELLEVTREVVNEDVECPGLHYKYSVIHVLCRG